MKTKKSIGPSRKPSRGLLHFKKHPVKRREGLERPYNNGEWTKARYIAFVKGALRSAQWPAKFACITESRDGSGINPKTGRKCFMHKCAICGGHFPAKEMKADHIIPVVGPEGFVSWDEFIRRLFQEREGYQALCSGCHAVKTDKESKERKKK